MSAGAFWGAAVAGAVVGLVLSELVDVSAWIAPKIVRLASARMPTQELRERYREEWLAELSAFDGLKLIKLGKAVSLWVNSWRTASVWRSEYNIISLVTYLKRVSSRIIPVSKSAWKGSPIGRAPISMPPLVLISYINQVILFPIGGYVNIDVNTFEDGDYRIKVFTDAEFSRPVAWLMGMIRIPIIVAFDLCMFKGGTPLRDMPKHHRNAWGDLRSADAKPGVTSSLPPSS